jgi:hypothetical protein
MQIISIVSLNLDIFILKINIYIYIYICTLIYRYQLKNEDRSLCMVGRYLSNHWPTSPAPRILDVFGQTVSGDGISIADI